MNKKQLNTPNKIYKGIDKRKLSNSFFWIVFLRSASKRYTQECVGSYQIADLSISEQIWSEALEPAEHSCLIAPSLCIA